MLRNLFKTICCVLLILPAMALQAQNDFVKTAIDATKRQYAPDSRTAIFAVEGELLNDSLCVLKGRCNNRQAVDTLLHRLDSAGIACVDGIKMLPDKNLGALTRGLVTVCCASLRGGPRHAAEMMTQAIMGTPLLVLERDKAWLLVQTPDHYISWVPANSVTLQDETGWKAWRESDRYVYTGYQGFVYDAPDRNAGIVSDIVAGAILQADGKARKGFVPVRFPDGRKGFLKSNECCDLARWAARPLDMEVVVRTARQMMGSTYLWGGTSVTGSPQDSGGSGAETGEAGSLSGTSGSGPGSGSGSGASSEAGAGSTSTSGSGADSTSGSEAVGTSAWGASATGGSGSCSRTVQVTSVRDAPHWLQNLALSSFRAPHLVQNIAPPSAFFSPAWRDF